MAFQDYQTQLTGSLPATAAAAAVCANGALSCRAVPATGVLPTTWHLVVSAPHTVT